jgi:hypothetical protein
MYPGTNSSFLYLMAIKSAKRISWRPMKKYLSNCFSKSAQLRIELAGKDANHVKADPDKDRGKSQTLKASSAATSPHCAKNRLFDRFHVVLTRKFGKI